MGMGCVSEPSKKSHWPASIIALRKWKAKVTQFAPSDSRCGMSADILICSTDDIIGVGAGEDMAVGGDGDMGAEGGVDDKADDADEDADEDAGLTWEQVAGAGPITCSN